MTRQELRNWILRRLGAPLLNIELDNSQIDDRIDEAISKFCTYHHDGSDYRYVGLQVNKDDVGPYTVPATVSNINRILNVDSIFSADDPLLMKPFYVGNQMYEMFNFSIVDSEFFRQRLDRLDTYYDYEVLFTFNPTTKKIYFPTAPKKTQLYYIEGYIREDSDETYYTNKWLQKYCAALCKLQWAQNISKFRGSALPGGIELNWETILAEGNAEVEKLELELDERYTEPPGFFTG